MGREREERKGRRAETKTHYRFVDRMDSRRDIDVIWREVTVSIYLRGKRPPPSSVRVTG